MGRKMSEWSTEFRRDPEAVKKYKDIEPEEPPKEEEKKEEEEEPWMKEYKDYLE